jgi:ABC-type phosphate/phosphonate transport system substrate-binding protein
VAQRYFGGAILALVAMVMSGSAADPDVQMGLYKSMFRDVPEAVVVALAKPMKSLLEETVGVTGEAVLFDDCEKLAEAVESKKVNLGVFHGFEYAWIKDKYPNLQPFLIAVPHGGRLQSVLVVKADSTVAKIADLGPDEIIIPRGTKPHCLVHLEDLRKGLDKTVAPMKNKPGMTVEEALTEIALGNLTATVVDNGALAAIAKSSPGTVKGLKVIARSEQFPYGVLVTHKDGMNTATRDKLKGGLTNAEKAAKGRPLLLLWGLQGFADVPAEYNDHCLTMLKAYPSPTGKTVIATPVSQKK